MFFKKFHILFCGMLAALVLVGSGCSTSTIEKRKAERLDAYNLLPAEQRELVDGGEIKSGMSKDAVYISWGKPDDILWSEDESGKVETWLYYGRYMREYRYWNYQTVRRGDSDYLVRRLESDYNPESFLKAELVFAGGKLLRWRTLPKPQD